MCGIAGILDYRDRDNVDPAILERMASIISYRGPDERGIWSKGPVGLAHARLAIVDIGSGQQPMLTADGNLAISFNGEIFNHVELRAELEAKGHRFISDHSDTEVILYAYREWGYDCVSRFNGQWAFALWDSDKKELFLSRDRLGIRPLFYARCGSTFLFGSELKAIFMLPDMKRRLDFPALADLFTLWSPLPGGTVFEDCFELPPGHSMLINQERERKWSYWHIDFNPETSPERPVESWAEELRSLLIDATRIRLRADVPVGAYLSGGLDSSVNAALIKRFSDSKLCTFSVAFEEEEFDEGSFQNDVISFLDTDHKKILCRNIDIGNVFQEVIWHTEKPVFRTAPAPFHLLSQLVREHDYKVVLTGEGADEMLGGYDIFKEAKIRRFWGKSLNSKIRPLLLKRLYPYLQNLQAQSTEYLKAFFHVSPELLGSPLFSHLPRWELARKTHLFFSAEVKSALSKRDPYVALESILPSRFFEFNSFEKAQFLETTLLLPGYILSSQGDRMTMANGVEGRYPFLDHRVAELQAQMPANVKMKVLDEKHVLKIAMRDLVPDSVFKRKKQPYRAPDSQSFFPKNEPVRLNYVTELLSRKNIEKAGIFNPKMVARLYQKAADGQIVGVKDNMSLVCILSTQILFDRFIENFSIPI